MATPTTVLLRSRTGHRTPGRYGHLPFRRLVPLERLDVRILASNSARFEAREQTIQMILSSVRFNYKLISNLASLELPFLRRVSGMADKGRRMEARPKSTIIGCLSISFQRMFRGSASPWRTPRR
ncbi:hypothetical protein I7I51_07369 [Histoplasma capsulatum]|uniref:Uncharacterized protein n=1 Tax=Ajellomyces capsulatus TaxID=5037 RepID=A0A8A1LVZ7_AJECA|nr:hypothetical protein I7I51_07369 [Histoplasma capsulatum]